MLRMTYFEKVQIPSPPFSIWLLPFYVDPLIPVMPCRLIHNYIRKTETISDLRSSAPLGARTLDPNIKSVVLYQLS